MRILFLFLGLLVVNCLALTQSSDRMTRSQYFETYKDLAIHEMRRSGIPASITLAQGALESGDGNSRLARNGNNHFGIKCHNNWTGKRIYHDDDARNECFRKYKSVEESYRDHSDYLKSTSRYASLFELDITDYKGWARGLKRAGYATSNTYAQLLIKIIEEYDLYRYDQMSNNVRASRERSNFREVHATIRREIFERNRVKFIYGKSGDTFESLTAEFGKLSWELLQYNDLYTPDSVSPGQIVYIQPKRNKAEAGKKTHVVKEGETMYTISQLYAIKLDRLYYLNNISRETLPKVGSVLQLRKPVKRTIPKPVLKDSMDNEDEDEEEIRIEFNP